MGDRPLGVTIICILGILGSLFWIGMGTISLGLGSMGLGSLPELGAMLSAMGTIVLVLGILLLLGFYWAWKMQKKGWTIVMVLEIIGIILSLATGDITSAALPVIIVLYLYLKRGMFS